MYFDIGANVGKWAIANAHNSSTIISVEASPITYQRLVNSVSMYNNIQVLNYAVCDNSGKDITFYDAHCDTISTINKDWLCSPSSRFCNSAFTEITCKTITLDSLIEIYGLPSLIKIDVEGGEYECIKSLSKKVDLLCFEWASEVNNITFNCLDYLTTLGFTKFYVQFTDNYTFRPDEDKYVTVSLVKKQLEATVPKQEWGMLWCK
jgi:FkbM family methyltransferase